MRVFKGFFIVLRQNLYLVLLYLGSLEHSGISGGRSREESCELYAGTAASGSH